MESDNRRLSLSSVYVFDDDAGADNIDDECVSFAEDGLPGLLDLAMREARSRARLADFNSGMRVLYVMSYAHDYASTNLRQTWLEMR